MVKKNVKDIVRSSAAEYLTFITAQGESDVNTIYADENVWLTQKMMGLLYDVGLPTIVHHLETIYSDEELTQEATIRNFRIVQNEGSRQVSRDVKHYNRPWMTGQNSLKEF